MWYIIIYVCLDPPEITANVADQDVAENDTSISFSCEAIGEPTPSISWHFNDVLINPSTKYLLVIASVVPGSLGSSLIILNLLPSDAGTYTCYAENVVGNDNSSGILTVNGNYR